MVVLPEWIDQAPKMDFEPEKEMLKTLELWAEAKGWSVSDGNSLPLELRQRTDVLLDDPKLNRSIRLAILRKSRNGVGAIRAGASNLRTVELLYQSRTKKWRLEAGGALVENDLRNRNGDWLIKLLFQP